MQELLASTIFKVILGFILTQVGAVTWALIKMYFAQKSLKARFETHKRETSERFDKMEKDHKEEFDELRAEHKEQMDKILETYSAVQKELHKLQIEMAVTNNNIQTLMVEKISSVQRERRKVGQ